MDVQREQKSGDDGGEIFDRLFFLGNEVEKIFRQHRRRHTGENNHESGESEEDDRRYGSRRECNQHISHQTACRDGGADVR